MEIARQFAAMSGTSAESAAKHIVAQGMINRTVAAVTHRLLKIRGTPLPQSLSTSAPITVPVAKYQRRHQARVGEWIADEIAILKDSEVEWNHGPHGRMSAVARKLKANGQLPNRSLAAVVHKMWEMSIGIPRTPTVRRMAMRHGGNTQEILWNAGETQIINDNWSDLEHTPYAGARHLHERGILMSRTEGAIANKVRNMREQKSALAPANVETPQPATVADRQPAPSVSTTDTPIDPADRALIMDIKRLDHHHKTGVSSAVWQQGIDRTTEHGIAFYEAFNTMVAERDVALDQAEKGKALEQYYKEKVAPVYDDFAHFAKDEQIQKRIGELKQTAREEKAKKEQAEMAEWDESDAAAKRELEVRKQMRQQH